VLKFCNSTSDLLPVISGMPQDSILEPLLFLVYINDLSLATQFSVLFLFADDAKLSTSITHISDKHYLQQDNYRSSFTWSIVNDLNFSTKMYLTKFQQQNIVILYTPSIILHSRG